MVNRKYAFAAALIALGTAAAGSAHAGDVHWSVGINLPQVGTVISNVPVYHAPRPVYGYPAPVVVYEPAPQVVYQPVPQVVYQPEPVYAPRYYGPTVIRSGWVPPRHGHGWRHDRHHRHGRHDRHDRHDRDDHQDHRDRGGDHRQHH